MSDGNLTAFERHALEALKGTDYQHGLRPSAVGYLLWEKSDPETRKKNPSAQGLALFGGKFLRSLGAAGLAHQHDGWYILEAGRAELREQRKENL